MEQQFLTAFNNNISYSTTARRRDKQTNDIVDFINATYQGQLSPTYELQGLGTIIDDQFNFILCENLKESRLNGEVFIKLANQISIWGKWRNNFPEGICSVQVGSYKIHIPYEEGEESRLRRPKRCLVQSKVKGKLYMTRVERNPEQYQNKRQFGIVIEKAKTMSESAMREGSQFVELDLSSVKLTPLQYIDYLCEKLGIAQKQQQDNGFFVSASNQVSSIRREQNQLVTNQRGLKLGLLIDKNKLVIKSVGIFCKNNQQECYCLGGLGLSKTTDSEVLMGIFKNDMLIKDFSYFANPEYLQKSYGRNLNGSVVKQMLSHEHMKSMCYKHNYLYFPEVKKIVTLAIELHKYVDMFERLSQQGQAQSSQMDQSRQDEQQKAAKYCLGKDLNQIPYVQQSSQSIIDQYKEYRVILKKEQYAEQIENVEQNQPSPQKFKKPGFILHRSPTPKKELSSNRSQNKFSPSVKLDTKIQNRTPPRHQQKWRL